jgi:hypothetical protein
VTLAKEKICTGFFGETFLNSNFKDTGDGKKTLWCFLE